MVSREATTWTEPPSTPVHAEVTSSIAAMGFVGGVAHCGTIQALRSWFRDDLLTLVGPPWRTIREPGHGPLLLDPSPDPAAIRLLLESTRLRVVASLRGLLETPSNDDFLGAFVGRGFVRRRVESTGVRWSTEVPHDRYLSELVLGLFSADILARRAVYDARLCVCDECGRVSFEPSQNPRNGCPSHRRPSRDFRRVMKQVAMRL